MKLHLKARGHIMPRPEVILKNGLRNDHSSPAPAKKMSNSIHPPTGMFNSGHTTTNGYILKVGMLLQIARAYQRRVERIQTFPGSAAVSANAAYYLH
jgi:hypothetical protein